MSIRSHARCFVQSVCFGTLVASGLSPLCAQQPPINVVGVPLQLPPGAPLAPIAPLAAPLKPIVNPVASAPQIAPIASPPAQHLPIGPLSLDKLPADVLNCNVCRERLGLPPIPPNAHVDRKNTSAPQSAKQPAQRKLQATAPQNVPVSPYPMLGTPGIISSSTAEQLATHGLVVEEFKPPQPEVDAFQLQGLPLEVRQQFMQSLDLPQGARIMSAAVIDPNAKPAEANAADKADIANKAASDAQAATPVEPRLPALPEAAAVPDATGTSEVTVAPVAIPVPSVPAMPAAPPVPEVPAIAEQRVGDADEALLAMRRQLEELNKRNHDSAEMLNQKALESQKLKADLAALQQSIEALKREAAALRKQDQEQRNKLNSKEKPKKRPLDKKNNLL